MQQNSQRKWSARQVMRNNNNNKDTSDNNPLPATKKRKATTRTVSSNTDLETQVDQVANLTQTLNIHVLLEKD